MNTDDPDVMNIAETVSVRWRPTASADRRLTYLEREYGSDSVYDYRFDIDASERLVAFDERVSGRFGRIDWNRDGTLLTYTRDGEVRVYDTGTGEETTPAPSDGFDAEPRFSPVEDRLAFLSGRDGANDVWTVRVDGSELTRHTEGANPSDEMRWAPEWSPSGDSLAYVAAHDWNGRDWADEAHLLSLSTGADERLTRGLSVTSVPSFGPEGRRVAFTAKRVAEPWYRHAEDVHVIDRETGNRRVYPVGASHQYNVQSLQWAPDGRKLYYPVRERGSQHVEALLLHDGSDAEGVTSRLTDAEGIIGGGGAGEIRLSSDGTHLAWPWSSHDSPATPQVHPTAGGHGETLRDPDTPDGVIEPEQFAFESYDGLYINAYCYRPRGVAASDPAPTLVQAHGGAHFQYNDGWHPLEQYLASQGYVVLAVDFRGSGGYGRPFQALSMGDWEGGEVADLREAARFARGLDYTTDAVGIYGGSWGGFMALHSIAQYPAVWDAAVEWYGVLDQFSDHAEADRVGRLLTERDLGGGPDEVEAAYRDASVHWRLDDVETPLAVLHGAEDARVPINQAEALIDAFEGRDVPFEATIYENEGHGFRDAENRRDAVERTRRWFDTHLRP
jgi:dipeptidyl aminopeptidase/acylaminoacyl peptidase